MYSLQEISKRIKHDTGDDRISEQLEAKRQAEQQYNHSGFGMVGNKNIKN